MNHFFVVVPLADYYILGGVVYQCPDLQSIINSRLVRCGLANYKHNNVYMFVCECNVMFFSLVQMSALHCIQLAYEEGTFLKLVL